MCVFDQHLVEDGEEEWVLIKGSRRRGICCRRSDGKIWTWWFGFEVGKDVKAWRRPGLQDLLEGAKPVSAMS